MKTARLLVTQKCKRTCVYCCNNYTSLFKDSKEVKNLDFLSEFEAVCITGGEPLLNVNRTFYIISQIKKINPDITIYIYTSWFSQEADFLFHFVDGFHISFHKGFNLTDCKDFELFQNKLNLYQMMSNRSLSLRLYINDEVDVAVPVIPSLYVRVKVSKWLTEEECPLPEGEEVFILKGWR